MIKKKILLADLDKPQTMKIGLSSTQKPIGLDELIQRDFLDLECENAINPIINHDKVKYTPKYEGQDVECITYTLYKNPSTPYTFSDFGFDDDDLKFRYDRFLNSFLRIQFFDSIRTTDRSLLFENTLFNQTNNLDLSTNTEMKYATYDSKVFPSIEYPSESFCLHWYADAVPSEVYMTHSFNNALDGEVTPLFSYQNIPQLNQVNNLSNTKITFDPISMCYEIDGSNKVMTYDSANKTLDICLFIVQSQ